MFLLAVEALTVPLFYFFFMTSFPLSETFLFMIVPLVVGTIGMAGVGTILSTITVNTRGRDVILAVLMIPLIFPLLYASVSATTAMIVGADGCWDVFTISLALAGGYDIVMVLVSWVLYDYVVSA